MQCEEHGAYRKLERSASNAGGSPDKKLTTGEYSQLLKEQYERLARHQQTIEAECQASQIH